MSGIVDELTGSGEPAGGGEDAPQVAQVSLAAEYFARISDMRARLQKYTTETGMLTLSGAIGLAAELDIVLMDDNEDALDALSEMDQNGDGMIEPIEFEDWFKRQMLENSTTPVQEQADLAATVVHALSSGKFAQDVHQREAARVQESAQRGNSKPTTKQNDGRPANAYGSNAVAWAAFTKLDKDNSGTLDREELQQLVDSLNMKMGAKQLDKHFEKMDPHNTGTVNFDAFCVFFNAIKAKERRKLIRKFKELFCKADERGTGQLRQHEFERLVKDSRIILDPPFDPDEDWESCNKTRAGIFPDFTYELEYSSFEAWYKERLGIDDPNIPVLPEYMVQKIEEAAFYGQTRKTWTGQTRSGRDLWDSLRPRLLALVRMQRQWGKFHDIYDGSNNSSFEDSDTRKGIRDPDSTFSAVWDVVQVVLLLYVSITVPLRAGFELTVGLWTFGFFFDLMIDVFFIVDIFLNFRTAFYTSTGALEDRPRTIAENYIRGWFPVDFISSLPLSYLSYLDADDTAVSVADGSAALGGGQRGGSNARALKALRLVRLSKMLRLARIKKVIQKYSQNVHLQTFISIGFTIFLILFLVHILACFFYLIGTADEERVMRDGSTVVIHGWVNAEENWEPLVPDEPTIPGTTGRYLASMYYVLNALENSTTDGEMAFALFAELMRDFILGMVAGLMATISMAMGNGDQEVQWKVRALKKWMGARTIPKAFQTRVSEHCMELWTNRSNFDIEEVFRDVPPSMRLNLASFLYRENVSKVPLFRDLGAAVIGAICNVVHPILVLRGQEVISEGQPGAEFYMVMRGELEVFKGNQDGVTTRLGYLSEGSFFGETAILSETGSECRTRTVVAVIDSELCFLTRDEIFKLGESFPELEARLRRFMTVGLQRLNRKGIDKTELNAIREFATTFDQMRKAVQKHENDRAKEFSLANDTVHVGSIPSSRPPHKDSMSEEMIADRFSEFGEILTAVVRYREAEEGKPHNSWALVVFKDNADVVRLMQGNKQQHVPAKRPAITEGNGSREWVEAKDPPGQGWSHVVRMIDPEQALQSTGSFGAIWQTCRQRVMGAKSQRKSVRESLRAQVQLLRNLGEDIHAYGDRGDGGDLIEQSDAHREMLGGLEMDSSGKEIGANKSDEVLVPQASVKDAEQDALAATGGTPRSLASWLGMDQSEPEPEHQEATVVANSSTAVNVSRAQQQTMMMAELLALMSSMNSRMKKQDAELSKVRRVVEQGARQGWSAPLGTRRK